MSIVDCRECGKPVSDEAKQCPHCGVENPYFKAHLMAQAARAAANHRTPEEGVLKKILRRFTYVAIAIVAVLTLIGKAPAILAALAKPSCEVVSVKPEPDLFLTDGEADAGVKVTALVRKLNRDGEITVSIRLSTSEGDWVKATTGVMKTNEQRNAILQFPEPTVNAQNIRAEATCKG
ncbi:zinc ribbon domain-containing protein [Neorhizobium galegae]|uniref:zinc ribbon domain-containing protein n=1 Tax=Neorhizobium galegae TaxID=399 RepID=UPI002107030E|nr:zinc ribbon domain-containing protein [Neorhizobium galegae]MCQ1835167.1 zinc ribbon domain-containing protein [Neorhizobium galegae]UIY29115.1 zinc ribbon domain-containing protein [Neorhizobium galegae]